MANFIKPEDIDIPQSLVLTDGQYGEVPNSGSEELQVFLPRQGFDLLYKNPNRNSGSTEITQDLDERFKLGTFTLNDRGSWENNNTNKSTLQPYLTDDGDNDLKPKTRPTALKVTPDGIIFDIQNRIDSNDSNWSVDALPFVVNPNNDEIIHLDRYYDKQLDKENYNLATEGKINYYIGLKGNRRIFENTYDDLASDYQKGNIDNFKPVGDKTKQQGTVNFLDYYVGDDDRGIYLFKLNWGDGTEIEFTDEPKLLESTTIFEHFYDDPGFYSITYVIYQHTSAGVTEYERIQTNIVLNPSPNYQLKLFDYNNFASIGGITKDSAFVKSLYNLMGVNPTNPTDKTRTDENLTKKFNQLEMINVLNTLGKVDYSRISTYGNFLSPYQTPTDDVDSFVFGCADPGASNYYLDISGSLPENTTLVDDGTCNYQHSVEINVGGPSSDNELPIPITIQEGFGDTMRTGSIPMIGQAKEGELTIREYNDSSELQQGLPTITLVGSTGSSTLNIVNRGDVTFSLIEEEILGDDENGLAFYDWNFAGWYKRVGTLPVELIGTDLSVTTTITQDTKIFARFYYLDVTPPQPVVDLISFNSENYQDLPFNSIGVFFKHPLEDTESFDYNDVQNFKIERFYDDYITGERIFEEIQGINTLDTENFIVTDTSVYNIGSDTDTSVATTLIEISDLNEYDYLIVDSGLPYREYGYRVTTVDESNLLSGTVSTSLIYPTPSDEQPDPLNNDLFTLEQINNEDLGINWQQIDESWPGLEGNFKHFKIEIQGPNGNDGIVQFVGDYNTDLENSPTNLIPTSYSSLNDMGTDIFNNGLVYKTRDTNGNLFNMNWAVKISVVAKALDSDLEQEGDSTVQKSIAPENLLEPATIEVGFDSNSDYVEIIQGFFLMQGNSLNTIESAFDPIGGTFTSISDVISVAQDGDVLEVYSAENDNIEGNYNIIIDEINNSITISPELPASSETRFSEGTPYTAQFKLKRNITISEINAYDDREASGLIKIPIPISYSVSGGTVPGNQVDLYMKAFIKEPTNNNPYIAINLQNRRDLQISSINTVDNYEVGLDIDNFNAVINGNMHIGLFDFNDTNLLNETQAIPIQEVFGCDDTNADNFTPLATRDFNCKYSFEIETESTTQDSDFIGTIRAVKMEFVENDDGSLNFNRAEVAGQIQNNNNQPTIDYDNFQTAREFVLINLDPINAQFITWEIPIPGLEFTDDVSFQGNELIFGNTQGFTTNLDDLNYLQRGNLLAVRIVPDEDGNRIASSTNFDDKIIRVVWAEEGLEYNPDLAIGTYGQNLNLAAYGNPDIDNNVFGTENYPLDPQPVEVYGAPYTGEGGYENQSSLGFVGPTNFTLMDNVVEYSEPDHPFEGSEIDLFTRIIEAQPNEEFELDGITYTQSFVRWEVKQGAEYIHKIYNDEINNIVLVNNFINVSDYGESVNIITIEYSSTNFDSETPIIIEGYFEQVDENGNQGGGKQPGG